MEKETAGVLRPTGGSRRFRRNCSLLAEEGAVAVTDRKGKTTRFALDGTDNAPAHMASYLFRDEFVVVDGKGRGLIISDDGLWDGDEQKQFCEVAGIQSVAVNADLPPLRSDGVRLEEAAWLRLYALWTPYVILGGSILAPIGRFFLLSVWLMVPFVVWILVCFVPGVTPLVFPPRRIGPAERRFRKDLADEEWRARWGLKRKAPTS